MSLICRKDDVYVGYAALGVVKEPLDQTTEWKKDHCWVCHRSRDEIIKHQDGVFAAIAEGLPDGVTIALTDGVQTGGEGVVRPGPSKALSTYVDKAMFQADEVPEEALERPRVYILSATPDPLGSVAAMSMMYEGRTIRSLSEITDDERRHYFDECFKTTLKAPLEAIDFHFMVEGMTRATFDQMRTQRTAVFAGESLRFAVKEEIVQRPGPIIASNSNARATWDSVIQEVWEGYLSLIGNGIPAEEARGLLPMNVLTRAHWKTNLRNLEAEIGKRLCTQAQFEWRLIHADLRRAIRLHDPFAAYHEDQHYMEGDWSDRTEDAWQFKYIADSPMFRPICFATGKCMFKAEMDRGCTIRERVEAGKFEDINDAEWATDPTAAWVR